MIHRCSQLPSGVIVPLVTPRNFSDLGPMLDHVVEGGVAAVFILGTTGETLKLDQKQRIEVIRKVAEYLRERVPLLVGIGAANLAESLELMHVAHEVGAAACVVVPNLWGGDGMHVVEELLFSSQGNLVLYNNPALTAENFLLVEQVKKLALEERILGIKDSSGDLEYFGEILKIKGHPSFKIYYGREHHLPEVLNKNIDGIVPGCANIEPELVSELWSKKGEGVWSRWDALRPLVKQEGGGDYLLGLKRMLKLRGLLSDAGVW
ncbi:MAG: dihydrodipicolinate synthase family protein [Chlamydiota bacterium]